MASTVKSGIRKQAEERCHDLITQGFDQDRPVLIEALPATGKSSGVVKWTIETELPLTVFTARHELYGQYLAWSEKFGLDLDRVKRLPSFHHDCPTAREEENHGEEWMRDVRRFYNSGKSGAEIHTRASTLFGQPLPCIDGETCPYLENLDYDPEDFDLLVGHYTHAYTDKPVENRYVAFDEFPEGDFLLEFDSSSVEESISKTVSKISTFGSKHATDFDEKYHKRDQQPEWILDFLFDREDPLDEWRPFGRYERDSSAENHSPVLIRTKYLGEKLDNGWRYHTFPNNCVAVRNPRDKSITLLIPPFLNKAESVIALDGTPTPSKWRSILGEDLVVVSAHGSNRARNEYLREGLGIRLIQTTTNAKPYKNTAGNNVTPKPDLALLEAISIREKAVPSLITSKTARRRYQRFGLEKIVDDIESKTDYYGNLKGKNDFGNDRLGVVIGSPHPNDKEVIKWAALRGHSVEAAEDEDGERKRGMATDFGQQGNPFLWDLRENEVLQAVMRFGREEDPQTGERGATVYVHTGALPHWVRPKVEIADIHVISPGMKEVIDAILDFGGDEWVTKDITENKMVTTTVQNVRNHLNKLADWGFIEKHGEGRGRRWTNNCIEEIGEFGYVEFSPDHPLNTVG